MIKSESIRNIAPAFFRAQTCFKAAMKDSDNPYFRSKYADLSSVWDAVKDALKENELMVTQSTGQHVDGVIVYTYIIHAPSAEFIGSELLMRASKKMDNDTYVPIHDPQAYGSLITYGRRYSLAALLGVITDDDDAEGAMGRKKISGDNYGRSPAASALPDIQTLNMVNQTGSKDSEQKKRKPRSTDTLPTPDGDTKKTTDGTKGMTPEEAKNKVGEVFDGSKDVSLSPADKIKAEFDKAVTVEELKGAWRKNRKIIEALDKDSQNELTIYAASLKEKMTPHQEVK